MKPPMQLANTSAVADDACHEAMPSKHVTRLQDSVAAFVALFDRPADHRDVAYHSVAGCMHELCASIREAELAGLSADEISKHVLPARELHGRSPFVRRIQTWPRGYPGDFETIEYLCSAPMGNRANTTESIVEQYCLRESAAQQHRNKIAWQAKMILQLAMSVPDGNMLSIACGGSRDLRAVQEVLGRVPVRVVLNDIDPDALALSLASLPGLAGQITTLQGNIFSSIRGIKRHGPYDLILIGGLLDYLGERQVAWLLSKLYPMLNKGGKLCFTNLASGNPNRVWMRYIADWNLVERDEEDIRRMLGEFVRPPTIVNVERDATGLTLLVTLTKQGESGACSATGCPPASSAGRNKTMDYGKG